MRITKAVLETVVAHAREALPNECCGLLVGTTDQIERAVRARNMKASPTRYLIDPADHFAVIKEARRTGRTVSGAYHSHPRGPGTPSPTDLAESHDPSLLHVIVSLAEDPPAVRAYLFRDGGYTPVALES